MDLEEERARLLETDARFVAAARSRDAEATLAFWADDATLLSPGQPPLSGKAALREMVEQGFRDDNFSIEWESTAAELSDDASMGFLQSRTTMTMSGPDGGVTRVEGPSHTVWRRDRQDGSWRCAVDVMLGVPG